MAALWRTSLQCRGGCDLRCTSNFAFGVRTRLPECGGCGVNTGCATVRALCDTRVSVRDDRAILLTLYGPPANQRHPMARLGTPGHAAAPFRLRSPPRAHPDFSLPVNI